MPRDIRQEWPHRDGGSETPREPLAPRDRRHYKASLCASRESDRTRRPILALKNFPLDY
jgi:hypothetical protein